MNRTRLELLRQYTEEEPGDPFNWYALALEEQKHDLARAEEIYRHLLTNFKTYVPTYYHAGLLQWQSGNHDVALKILKEGIIQCEAAGDHKTKREIEAAIFEIGE